MNKKLSKVLTRRRFVPQLRRPRILRLIPQFLVHLMVAQFLMLTLVPWPRSRGGGQAQISVTGSTMASTKFLGKHIVTGDVTLESLEMSSK
jgi:hypothetical protein